MNRKLALFSIIAMISLFQVCPYTGQAARDGGYDVTSRLWTKAILEVPGFPVPLIWTEVGSDITPSGDQVISGYFYADPNVFAFGSPFNPEVFVKIFVSTTGWCNIAFNHVTVDNVTVSSAHLYAGVPQQTGTASLTNRLVEDQYDGVQIVEETITYSSHIQQIVSGNCLRCHSVTVVGVQRNGAPADHNFDTYENVLTWVDRMSQRIQEGTMPPLSDGIPLIDRAVFQIWIDNGLPR